MPVELHATLSLVEGMHIHGENSKQQGTEFDSVPEDSLGAGPSPMELLLQAAGACSLMDVAAILRKRKIAPTILSASVSGVKRDEHPKIFQAIEIVYRAKGEGITVEELERAANLSLTTYCSVFGMLGKVAEVTHRCELIA